MTNSISFIHFYVAPFLILLSVIRLFSLSIKENPLFFLFVVSIGILGLWEMSQLIISGPYFFPLEAVFLGLICGSFLSLGIKCNNVSGDPKKHKVLAKLPILGALALLTLFNLYSIQSSRICFLLVLLGTLAFYAKKNIQNKYFKMMGIFLLLGLFAQHFKMDEILKSILILLGIGILIFKLPSLEREND
ncbi:MAG: hypothetical protein DRQ88_12105 [Epsilonproteobacteria bacterium]|nr:MAG: hypothetical protein DRQ88_12105 [Campylobacterota bacterium]RLA64700.1 MAG: hypothetical protein DRQ89_03295 [Campylobacterota bacterium]